MRSRKPILSLFVFLTTFSLACASTTKTSSREDTGQETREQYIDVHLQLQEDEDQTHLVVSLQLPLSWIRPAPSSVLLYFAPISFMDGNNSPRRFIEVLEGGQWSSEAERIEVPVPVNNAPIWVHYRVSLSQHVAHPLHGLDDVPHPTSGGWTVPGSAIFPSDVRLRDERQVDMPSHLLSTLPPGWTHSSGLAGDNRSFLGLSNTVHQFGNYKTKTVELDGARVTLVTSDYSAEELVSVISVVEKSLNAGNRWLGSPATGQNLRIILDRIGESHEGGLVGDTVVITGPNISMDKASELPARVLVHELGHLWNRADEPWLNEGFTRLLEMEVAALLDELNAHDATAALAVQMHRYQALAGAGISARQPGPRGWPYQAGAAVLICLEARLREYGSGLLALHRQTRSKHGYPLTAESFISESELLAPGAASLMVSMLDSMVPIQVEGCLEKLGFDASTEETRVPTARTVVVDILQATSLGTSPLIVKAIAVGSKLVPGDKILTLAGKQVVNIQTMQEALVDLASGTLVPIGIERAGKGRTILLTIPSLGADQSVTRQKLVLAPGSAGGTIFASQQSR